MVEEVKTVYRHLHSLPSRNEHNTVGRMGGKLISDQLRRDINGALGTWVWRYAPLMTGSSGI